MRGRLLHIDWNPEDTPEALHEAYRAATDPLVKSRLHALWLLRTGKRMAEVAPLLGFVYRTVQKWLDHYRQRAGLRSSGCRHAGTFMNSRTMSGRIGMSRIGAEVVVLERGPAGFATRGGGLGVSPQLCHALAATEDAMPRHVVHQRRRLWIRGAEHEEAANIAVTSYGILWRWLRAQLPESMVEFGQTVALIDAQTAHPRVTTTDARARAFDLVVAADGGGSEARRHVLADDAHAAFAGYVLWRGLVPFAALDDRTGLYRGTLHIANRGDHHFVGYTIPSEESCFAAMNWGWYVPTDEATFAELRAEGAVHLPYRLG